jgi:hypothetical protein
MWTFWIGEGAAVQSVLVADDAQRVRETGREVGYRRCDSFSDKPAGHHYQSAQRMFFLFLFYILGKILEEKERQAEKLI